MSFNSIKVTAIALATVACLSINLNSQASSSEKKELEGDKKVVAKNIDQPALELQKKPACQNVDGKN